MISTILNSFRVPEIRRKLAFTAALLALYRLGAYIPVKILGRGELSKKLTVSAHGFSKSARAAIESAGGTATIIE